MLARIHGGLPRHRARALHQPGAPLRRRRGGALSGAARNRFADLGPRLASGVALAGFAYLLLSTGGTAAAVLIAVMAAAMIWEWRSITAHQGGMPGIGAAAMAAAGAAAVMSAHAFGAPGLAVLALAVVAALLIGMARGQREAAFWAALGVGLISLGATAFLMLLEHDPYGFPAILWVVLVVVATDVGGYFAGRVIGGPKLWPSVSPKKTWAGLGGAVVLATVTGAAFSWATDGTFFHEVCAVSALAALAAQSGDLGESALKRRFGVKDSGTLIPGHGGVLDRCDGLLAATLLVALVTYWRGQTVFIWQ